MTLQTEIITELLKRAREEHQQPHEVLGSRSGIWCPHQGPDKPPIWCGVFKNLEDYNKEGDAGHDPIFCRRHCQYGRNPEYARLAREVRDRKRGIYPQWMKAMGQPPAFMFPKRGRRLP